MMHCGAGAGGERAGCACEGPVRPRVRVASEAGEHGDAGVSVCACVRRRCDDLCGRRAALAARPRGVTQSVCLTSSVRAGTSSTVHCAQSRACVGARARQDLKYLRRTTSSRCASTFATRNYRWRPGARAAAVRCRRSLPLSPPPPPAQAHFNENVFRAEEACCRDEGIEFDPVRAPACIRGCPRGTPPPHPPHRSLSSITATSWS